MWCRSSPLLGTNLSLPIEEIDFSVHEGVSPLQIVVEHALVRSETLICRDGFLRVEEIHRLEKVPGSEQDAPASFHQPR
jgi:hypothetical protein